MAVQFAYMRVHTFWLYAIAAFDLTLKKRTTRPPTKQQQYDGLRYLFCNKFIPQSNDKDLLLCFIKQIMNVLPFVQWCFHDTACKCC